MLRYLTIGAVLILSGCGTATQRRLGAVRGSAYHAGWLYYWGDGLRRILLPDGIPQNLSGEQFEPGGCVADLNLDGVAGLVLQTGGRLVWIAGPDFASSQTIDTEAGFSDCLAVELLGHRGLLVAHRGLQVRFYEKPRTEARRWPYREIYSFYTASYQAGLLFHDVDGDGRPDILCGNYWIQSPASFELPWRLYAINTYNDTEDAAHVRLAMIGDRLLVVQAEKKPAKVALFRPPPDPRQLWKEERLEGAFDLDHPVALAVAAEGFATGERGGRGRVMWWQPGDGRWRAKVLGEGTSVVGLFLPEGSRGLYAVRRQYLDLYTLPLE